MSTDDLGHDPVPASFGPLLKHLRTTAELTQEELAERAGVSARLISDLERGIVQRPRRDTIRMLADGLRLPDPDRETFTNAARGRSTAETGQEERSSARSNLPLPPGALVGREREVAATTSLLLEPEVRLLTLTGPGGVGKTRLALDVAARATGAFADGVWFVDLAPVADPVSVLSTIAHILGVRERAERPLRDDLVDALSGKRLLLLLDNFEHLAPAAPAIADLLGACSGLTILATSRRPLHVRAEREYPVAPLAVPDLDRLPVMDELALIPSIDLFVRLAESARRSFALTPDNAAAVAEIAVRLDGLPLAIELAAARTRILAPAALLARLEHRLPLLTGGAQDLPTRQQTLRATLDWSYDLLSPAEQSLFRRLAVFVGGFSLEAAEALVGGQRDRGIGGQDERTSLSPLDGTASLVDHSLLRLVDVEEDESRFGMLETMREYGLEQLVQAGEEIDARNRHAAWCVAFAERAAPALVGADQERWFKRVETEHDNLRAALDWSIERRDAETAMRLTGALDRFWSIRGHYAEARRWLDQALAVDEGAPSLLRARTLAAAGIIAFFQGDYGQAVAVWQEALPIFKSEGDEPRIGNILHNLGIAAHSGGDYDRAEAFYEEALSVYRERGNRHALGAALNNFGRLLFDQGDYARAATVHEEALALRRELGDREGTAYSLAGLGHVAHAQGDYARAGTLQAEALALRRDLSSKIALAESLENFALLAAATNEPTRAVQLFAAADRFRTENGAPLTPNDRAMFDPGLTKARDQLGESLFAAAWEAGHAMEIDEAVTYALEQSHPVRGRPR